jgi:hypothetical protein
LLVEPCSSRSLARPLSPPNLEAQNDDMFNLGFLFVFEPPLAQTETP